MPANAADIQVSLGKSLGKKGNWCFIEYVVPQTTTDTSNKLGNEINKHARQNISFPAQGSLGARTRSILVQALS